MISLKFKLQKFRKKDKLTNTKSFPLGFFDYSSETERREEVLFEAGKRLRTALGKDANNLIINRFFVETNLDHQFDLHGRRRCMVSLEYFKVAFESSREINQISCFADGKVSDWLF